MVPTFMPGDHVLTLNWGRFTVGNVIVFEATSSSFWGAKRLQSRTKKDSGQARMKDNKKLYFLKRIKRVTGSRYLAAGDNKKESTSKFLISRRDIVGKVIFKY